MHRPRGHSGATERSTLAVCRSAGTPGVGRPSRPHRGGAGPVPRFVFRLAGPVEGHHDVARFTWELVPAGTPADAEAPVVGFDVLAADEGGRLHTVVGFLDRVPAT
ncbi:hypothetical protein [Modestobacter sp. I12A-02662]|uniref:hypothetical protein n=1 Tax=Modestobacter sp. I12A-02662 TaxID=1730496 RepID=UPI0034DDEF3A